MQNPILHGFHLDRPISPARGDLNIVDSLTNGFSASRAGPVLDATGILEDHGSIPRIVDPITGTSAHNLDCNHLSADFACFQRNQNP